MRTSRSSILLPLRVTLAGSLLTVAAVTLVSVPMASASTLGGTATIVDETTAGGSASTDLLTVTFPTGSACTGSSNSGYYEYSYLIPQGSITQANFASTLTYNGDGEPSQGLGLVESPSGDIFDNVATAPPTTSGGPGELANVPADFQWAQLITQDDISLTGSSGLLYDNNTSGIWEAGIACAKNNGSGTFVISDYWNTEVTFTYSSSDTNHFTWAAVPGLGTWVPEARWAVVLPVAGTAVLGGGWWLSRRRRSVGHGPLDVAGAVDD